MEQASNRAVFQKKLKQHFQLEYFVGDNPNAIELRIWYVLISVLLLPVIYERNEGSLVSSNVTVLLSFHLVGYNSIKDLLELYKEE